MPALRQRQQAPATQAAEVHPEDTVQQRCEVQRARTAAKREPLAVKRLGQANAARTASAQIEALKGEIAVDAHLPGRGDGVVKAVAEVPHGRTQSNGSQRGIVAPVDFDAAVSRKGEGGGNLLGLQRKPRSAVPGRVFGIDVPFTAGRYDLLPPVSGNHIRIDDETVRVEEFVPAAERIGQGERGVANQQIHDALDGTGQVQGYIIQVLTFGDGIFTHAVPPFLRFPTGALR